MVFYDSIHLYFSEISQVSHQLRGASEVGWRTDVDPRSVYRVINDSQPVGYCFFNEIGRIGPFARDESIQQSVADDVDPGIGKI